MQLVRLRPTLAVQDTCTSAQLYERFTRASVTATATWLAMRSYVDAAVQCLCLRHDAPEHFGANFDTAIVAALHTSPL